MARSRHRARLGRPEAVKGQREGRRCRGAEQAWDWAEGTSRSCDVGGSSDQLSAHCPGRAGQRGGLSKVFQR